HPATYTHCIGGAKHEARCQDTVFGGTLPVPVGCTTELNHLGHQFLQRLFDKYNEARAASGYLGRRERKGNSQLVQERITQLEKTSDRGTFRRVLRPVVVLEEKQQLSAYLDIHRCLEYLGYLGYPILTQQNTQTTAVTVTRKKAVDLEKGQTQRSVFLCKVIGLRGTGKSAFLQVFLGRNTAEKFLILYEVDVETEFLKASDAACDVACLMYDTNNPHSFDYCASIYKQHYMDSSIPCVVVASKADLPEVRQLHGMTPAEFCYKHRLPPPLPFSGLPLDSTSKNIYTKLAWAAMLPHLNDSDMSNTWLRVTLGAAVVTVLGFAIYRAFAQQK
ncbi:mitochondrial Rho GTPase 2, partial [Salmo trutta]|uniref:mitochondrial Rho GTPase 2 n=1 Tax=Salmo trutta TaxID=8032 RepID=UPI001130B88C